MGAVRTAQETTQRKGFVYIDARGRTRLSVQALLNARVCLETDKWFMLSFPQGDTPFWNFKIARIEWLGQHDPDPFDSELPFLVFGEQGLRFEKAFHFRLRFKATAGEPFKSLCNDSGDRLMAIHHLAASRSLVVAIALRLAIYPKSVLGASVHTVLGLLGVLLALMLGRTRQNILDEIAVRVLAEHNGWRF
ncbi:hypothetical protein OOT33_00110 [Sphingobium sp. DEHP117]|nr:hypothetical protein [Sphingobium sp. DEHP117]MDQ4418850.1 hypothetical protein [Sphingobium sp. DEHP117]